MRIRHRAVPRSSADDPVERAGQTMNNVFTELHAYFGLTSTDAIAAIVVGRSLNRAAAGTI